MENDKKSLLGVIYMSDMKRKLYNNIATHIKWFLLRQLHSQLSFHLFYFCSFSWYVRFQLCGVFFSLIQYVRWERMNKNWKRFKISSLYFFYDENFTEAYHAFNLIFSPLTLNRRWKGWTCSENSAWSSQRKKSFYLSSWSISYHLIYVHPEEQAR